MPLRREWPAIGCCYKKRLTGRVGIAHFEKGFDKFARPSKNMEHFDAHDTFPPFKTRQERGDFRRGAVSLSG